MAEFELKEGLFTSEELSSEQYHGLSGTYSSSQLKDCDDPEYFHKKYILKEIEKVHIPAFDVGTFFHTSLLEPDKLHLDCAVFTGIRRGKAWDDFQATHAGKAIITDTEYKVALGLVKAVQESPVSMGRLKRGDPEVSAFIKLRVVGSFVYAITWGKKLDKYGWVDAKVPAKGTDIWVKVRADLLGEDFILDLKSTTGNCKDANTLRKKVADLQYDLSASLYLDIFSAARQRIMSNFIWTFSSKDYFNARSYLASQDMILIGRAKWKKAVIALAEGIENNWVFQDSMGILNPPAYEYEIIRERPEDLL